MSDKEIHDMKLPGYDKWKDMAQDIYELYTFAHGLRDDLIVIFMAHSEGYVEDGVTKYRTKTSGKAMTRFNLNGKLTYNLYTHVEIDPMTDKPVYKFITQNLGVTEARSSYGAFDSIEIPNDMAYVIEQVWTKDLELNINDLNTASKKSADNE